MRINAFFFSLIIFSTHLFSQATNQSKTNSNQKTIKLNEIKKYGVYPLEEVEVNRLESQGERGGIQEKNLFNQIEAREIFLKKTDTIELLEIKVKDKVHKKVILEGNVQIDYKNGSIEADKIVVNLETRELNGRGNVKLTVNKNVIYGDSVVLKINEVQGYIDNASGLQQGNYYRVKTFRINSTEHFTLEDGWVTFSQNDDPFYRVYFEQVDIYGDEKTIFKNPVAQVHNHGFFWIPYFNRYPLSSGLDLAFGETRREGFYLLTKTVFYPPFIKKLDVIFNVYEKLGYYLNLVNENTILNSNYKLDFTGALYTDNQVAKDSSKLTYSHNTGPYVNSESSFRYKVAYDHNFQLIRQTESNVSSDLKFSLYNTSDPLLTHNFSRSLSLDHLDIQRLIERHDRDESKYILPSNPSDDDFYKLNYSLTAPSTSLTVRLDWLYDVYDDPNKQDESIDERYQKFLKTVILPDIKFSHSGTFDPNADGSLLHFNIPYSIGLSYSGRSTFKDGSPAGVGTGNDVNVEPYELLYDQYSLSLNGSVSRPFSFDRDQYSLLNFDLDWFSWTINPSVAVGYSRNWEGKNFTTQNNRDKDRSILNLKYSVSSSIDLLNSISSFVGFSIGNSWSLTDQRTTLFFEPEENNGVNQEESKKISTGYNFNLPIDFPSGYLKGVWQRSLGFESMLPVFDLDFSYSLSKRTSDEVVDTDPLALDIIDQRSFSLSLNGSHSGFGFLYIPYLNYVLTSKVNFSYDLLPIKDEEGRVISSNFFTDPAFWNEERINNFNGSTTWNFNLNIDPVKNSLNNSLTYNFYDNQSNQIEPELILYSFSYAFSVGLPDRNGIFDLNNLSINFNLKYNYLTENYQKDSMNFSLGLSLRIIKLFDINFSFSAANPNAYLYYKVKADYFGAEQVNFFEDIVDSFGINGLEKQRNSLFKLNRIRVQIVHDIDDWQASFSYTFFPVSFVENSFRGFYFDHVVSFEVNLKPERDPRGSKVAINDPFFDDINRTFTPPGFE